MVASSTEGAGDRWGKVDMGWGGNRRKKVAGRGRRALNTHTCMSIHTHTHNPINILKNK